MLIYTSPEKISWDLGAQLFCISSHHKENILFMYIYYYPLVHQIVL